MRNITAKDIDEMIQSRVVENLKATAGKGKKQKIIIAPGFKIEHVKSGLEYTVRKVRIEDGKPVITVISSLGNRFDIHSKDFEQYRGL